MMNGGDKKEGTGEKEKEEEKVESKGNDEDKDMLPKEVRGFCIPSVQTIKTGLIARFCLVENISQDTNIRAPLEYC